MRPSKRHIIILFILSLAAFIFLNTRHVEREVPEKPRQEIAPPESLQSNKNIGSGELLRDAIELIRDVLEASLDFNATVRTGKLDANGKPIQPS